MQRVPIEQSLSASAPLDVDAATTGIDLSALAVESAVEVTGCVRPATLKDKALSPRTVELQVTALRVIAEPSVHPLPLDTTKKQLTAGLDTLLDLRPLSLRHPRERAVFRIAATLQESFAQHLSNVGFTRINSPKIVFTGAEGGANVYAIEHFGKKAFLAQSPQFYKQMMVGVFGRVHEIGPVFRAEKHKTSRHVNEYTSLDLEMQLEHGMVDIIQVEAGVLRAMLAALAQHRAHDLELLGLTLPRLEEIVTVAFDEVHRIVYETCGRDYRAEPDLAPEEEQLIGEYARKEWDTEFLFVTHYPTVKRPFYTMDDPAAPTRTLSFDLLFRGVEITTGGQRMHRYDDYIAKMERLGMRPSEFESYLQAFRYGMPPHGGLGMGLERLTAQLCGLPNIRQATLFPRDVYRLEP
ncbi:MAG: aspartate--tRNA(Asn) ligase [Chitinivibrionales bacterium]|nr:aspartate--tRNA(Asn) ligase [Chitinivibrionales bacterium]